MSAAIDWLMLLYLSIADSEKSAYDKNFSRLQVDVDFQIKFAGYLKPARQSNATAQFFTESRNNVIIIARDKSKRRRKTTS